MGHDSSSSKRVERMSNEKLGPTVGVELLPCKHIASALAANNIRDLTGWKRFYVQFHAALCPLCGPFHRDVIKMQINARAFTEREEFVEAQLSDKFKERMHNRLRLRIIRSISNQCYPTHPSDNPLISRPRSRGMLHLVGHAWGLRQEPKTHCSFRQKPRN